MTQDGVFVDCRSHWEGRIGTVRVRFAKHGAPGQGAITIGVADKGGELAQSVVSIGARLRLVCTCVTGASDHGKAAMVRQECDPAPKFSFFEEGPVRIGLRVAFDLLDEQGHYHGDGRLDVWAYREGDVHVTYALEALDRRAHSRVEDVYLDVGGAKDQSSVQIGSQIAKRGGGEVTVPFGSALPEKCILLSGGERSAALYSARDQGIAFAWGSDPTPVPPYYTTRWPTGMEQWLYAGKRMGWTLAPGAAVTAGVSADGPHVRMAWLRNGADQGTSEGKITYGATLVVSVADQPAELQRRVKALQNPLELQIVGGKFRSFAQEDGTYEVGQGDPTHVAITFPADDLERIARVRYFRRKTDLRHRGAVEARVNGQPVRAQLMSEGELTNDICVPMEMTHRNDSVDDVIVSVPLNKSRPTELVIDKVPGIHAVYESEIAGLDLQRRWGNRRDVVIWSSRNKRRPALEFDLFSSAVHRVTAHGQADPALWEVPMAWFDSCGHSQQQYCNNLRDFRIEKNGPDEVRLYARSVDVNGRTQSETWLRIPGDHPRLRYEVTMRMTVLEQWDFKSCEFTDIFPFPSRLPETWFYQGVLFMDHAKSSMVYTYRPDTSHYATNESPGPRLFYGLFASDRGNVLTLFNNRQHPRGKFAYSVCGNYVDLHVDIRPEKTPLPAGATLEIDYICELYGDAQTSVDEIRQIGARSLAAGDIVVP